jgi:hypothetical protein
MGAVAMKIIQWVATFFTIAIVAALLDFIFLHGRAGLLAEGMFFVFLAAGILGLLAVKLRLA